MRILDRYVLREIAVPFLLGLGLFTLVLLIARILKIIELVVNRGVPLFKVILLFSYVLPGFLEVTVPMALLFAILIAFGRFASDSELTALKAAGVSPLRLGRATLLFAVGAAIVTLGLALYVRPWANALLRNGIYELAKSRASAAIRPRVFSDEFAGLVLYVDEVEPPGNLLKGILISGNLPGDPAGNAPDLATEAPKSVVVAKIGMLIPDEERQVLRLRLLDGSLHAINADSGAYQRTDFGTFDIRLDLSVAINAARKKAKEPREMTIGELRQSMMQSAHDSPDEPLQDEIEYYRRFAIPFACIGFAAVAMPLGMRTSGSVRTRSLGISLAVILGYYLLLTLGESLAERRYLAAPLALWLPNFSLATFATILLRQGLNDLSAGHRPEVRTGWTARVRAAFAERPVV